MVSVLNDEIHKILSKKEHVHEPNPLDSLERDYRSQLKKKSVDSTDIPSRIVREVASNNPQVLQTRATKFAQKMVVYRVRQKELRRNYEADNDGGERWRRAMDNLFF